MGFSALYGRAIYGSSIYSVRGAVALNNAIAEAIAASDSRTFSFALTTFLSESIAAYDNANVQNFLLAVIAENVVSCDDLLPFLAWCEGINFTIECEEALDFRIHPFTPRIKLEWEEDREGVVIREDRAGETARYHTPPAKAERRGLVVDKEGRNTGVGRSDRVF